MSQSPENQSPLDRFLSQHGRVDTLEGLQTLMIEFERVLKSHRIEVRRNSELETACLAIVEVATKHQHPEQRSGSEDFRSLFGDVLGIWSLIKLIVQFQHHPKFPQFIPHLNLLNEGAVVQNSRLPVSIDASNKIFELLFALVLLGVGTELLLDHPSLARGDNPDILVKIDGRRWGFALKTIYGPSPKTFFDNLKKGVHQIQDSPAEIGVVVVNFRNLIDHSIFLPVMNPEAHAAGEEPDFGGYHDAMYIRHLIGTKVKEKEDEVRQEIGQENIDRLFTGMKAIPGFVAFYQTSAKKLTFAGPVPSEISSLGIAPFGDVQSYIPTFELINQALHQRLAAH